MFRNETEEFFEQANCYQGDRDAWERLWAQNRKPRGFSDDAPLCQDDYEFLTGTGRYHAPEEK